MKKIVFLIAMGLLTMLGAVGCDEEHEHHNPYGGTYNGYYQGYGQGYDGYNGYHHHDDDDFHH